MRSSYAGALAGPVVHPCGRVEPPSVGARAVHRWLRGRVPDLLVVG